MKKLEFVFKEVKEIYPNTTDEEIQELINEALQEKSIQNIIVNFICHVKSKLGK